MAVTAARVRTLALSLAGVTSYPHFDRIAFRIPQRTFATLARDDSDLNLLFVLGQQAQFCELAPLAITPVAGGWGRMGWTRCELKKLAPATLVLALNAAYARASAPRTRKGTFRQPAALEATPPKPGKSGRLAKPSKPKPAEATQPSKAKQPKLAKASKVAKASKSAKA